MILPYLQTSNSAVLQLAFETGLLVIASDVGGLRESIKEGVNGLLVRPGDNLSLAQAILGCLREGMEEKMCSCILKSKQISNKWVSIVSVIESVS